MRESYGEGPASHTGPQPSAMRLSRLTDAEWKDGGGVSLYAYRYDYDLVGNHTKLLYNGTPTYYAYNAANELTDEWTPGGDRFESSPRSHFFRPEPLAPSG